ncbi:MAG: methylenetetrahydrofolate reductase [NAD(P)H] [Pirellulaceae bacterium]|nr:methylenetetrahydrofolate reductase [NAD(P)H] [Pirellulaceae bacterium]
MQLGSFYGSGKFVLSYELFPPRTAAGEERLLRHVDRLVEYGPSFFTCTYGAGGSTRDRTLDIIERVKRMYGVPVASHLTCVGATVDDLRQYLSEAKQRGVDYIVAIRGDPPRGQREFAAVDGGLRHANELVALIRAEFPNFGIAVAGYPETHREATSPEVDLQNLKRKVDAGADIVITQLFYNNDDYFRFRDRCEQIGIRVPVVPGILPVTSLSQIRRLTSLCGASLPDDLIAELGKSDQPDSQFCVGVEFAARQVRDLMDRGVPGIHFYVLNKSEATSVVLSSVNMPSSIARLYP